MRLIMEKGDLIPMTVRAFVFTARSKYVEADPDFELRSQTQ